MDFIIEIYRQRVKIVKISWSEMTCTMKFSEHFMQYKSHVLLYVM